MAHDTIIIGAGHNGLVAANYLADAGHSVLVLERREVLGGATVTEEVIPGFRASACSYVSGLLHPSVLSDLDLRQHGLDLYQTDMGTANLLPDGRHLFLFNDLSAALRDIERVSPGESEGFVELGLRLSAFARIVRPWLLETSPPTLGEVITAFEHAGEQDLFQEFFALSALDLVDRYLNSDILRGLVMFVPMVSVFGGPRTPGWSYVYGHHAIGEFDGKMGQFAFPRGGMGSIADALAARAVARGVTIRTASPVERVLVDGNRACGVVLAGGDEIRSRLVLSNADPQHTFLELVPEADVPANFRARLRRYDNRGSMARVFVAVDGLPSFAGRPPGDGPEHRGLTLLGAEVDRFERVADAQRAGRVPDEFPIELIIQSVHDDSLAPSGQHIISTGIQQLPFTLTDGTWDDHRDDFTKAVIGELETYIPDLRRHIIGTHTITPLDLQRTYGITGGNIFHGALTLGQIFEGRPSPGFGSYRSPIIGLYLGGSGAHPGGGVTGIPGRNAALAILGDEADGGWRQRGHVSRGRAGRTAEPLVERALRDPRVRRLAVRLARDPRLSRAVSRLSRR